MGLLINQGKQDTSNDILAPVVEDNAQLVIHSLGLVKGKPGMLEVCLRVLAGPNKNRLIFDRVSYDAKDKMSYKYRQLRAAAGVPYASSEPEQIDIEALLLNRPLVADLGIREYEKDGQTRKAQNIKYHRDGEDVGTTVALNDENELNVLEEKPEEPKKTPQKASKHSEKEKPEQPVKEKAEPVEQPVAEAIEEDADEWE